MNAFLQNLAEALNQPDLEISPESRLKELPNWDSLAILTTLSMLDQEYGVMLSGIEIQTSETVRDLFSKVQAANPDA
ncbi:MAG TPA: acyl carrier protein [Oceanipulchritudo sp.]|nr:acyl carrier protein [Oceanipulchritudo sp.]